MKLPHLMVAPNGARLTKSDHPNLPMTLPEIVEEARACFDAGADGLHLHLRDAAGQHLLDAGAYREALAELNRAVPNLAIQITTEAVGKYDPPHQLKIALSSGAYMVSASIREITADGEITAVQRFIVDCKDQKISLQIILYDTADFDVLMNVLKDIDIRETDLQLLFVLGRYADGQNANPLELSAFLSQVKNWEYSPEWAICAFGKSETACLYEAYKQGGKLRVGFENSIWNCDGSVAQNNAERVAEIKAGISAIPIPKKIPAS